MLRVLAKVQHGDGPDDSSANHDEHEREPLRGREPPAQQRVGEHSREEHDGPLSIWYTEGYVKKIPTFSRVVPETSHMAGTAKLKKALRLFLKEPSPLSTSGSPDLHRQPHAREKNAGSGRLSLP